MIALLQDMTLAEIADKASESEKKLKTESGVDANREM